MTEQENELIFDLIIRGMSREEFLNKFRNSTDGQSLARQLLEEAIADQNAVDLEMALMVAVAFNLRQELLPILLYLEPATWHQRHEDVVSLLDGFESVLTVHALYHATQWIPEYLNFDEARALAVKAIWGLGAIEGREADEALQKIAASDVPVLATNAVQQIERRRARLLNRDK
jgi:hypothetical protein